jgi:tetratricopeptide (TPR) repeat protein
MPRAIGRVVVGAEGHGSSRRGTTFAISPNLALTAFHCVGDRGQRHLFEGPLRVEMPGLAAMGAVVIDYDADGDWALLRLDADLPPDLDIIPLRPDPPPVCDFRAIGFPVVPTGSPDAAVHGKLIYAESRLQGARAIQLFCEQSAAGMVLHGMSGAPVLVGEPEAAAGILRWNPPRSDYSDAAYAATVYACPIEAVLRRRPELRRAVTLRSRTYSIHKLPPLPCPHFRGREDILESLRTIFLTADERGVPTVQIVYGLGGVGKTQLALEYCRRYGSLYDIVWWVPSERSATRREAFAELGFRLDEPDFSPARPLGAVTSSRDDTIDRVRSKLEKMPKWLVVFDNVQSPNDVQEMLPTWGSGNVLMTTRAAVGWRAIGQPRSLHPLLLGESVDFLVARTGDTDRESARTVAETLGNLPLALEQAAGYVDGAALSLSSYLKILRRDAPSAFSGPKPLNYGHTVATTWRMAFGRVAAVNPVAADVLALSAFLDGTEIPRWLLVELHGAAGTGDGRPRVELIDGAIADLLRHSLASAVGGDVSVHRLVQWFTRDRMSKDERRRWCDAAVGMLSVRMPERPRHSHYYSQDDWTIGVQLLPHVLAVGDHGRGVITRHQEFAEMLARTAAYLRRMGDARKALELDRQAFALRRRSHPLDRALVAQSLNAMGVDYTELGMPEPAERADRHAVELGRLVYDSAHPWMATFLNDLGVDLRDLGRSGDALPLLQEAVEVSRKTYGEDSPGPSLAWFLHNLASVVKETEGPSAAVPYLRQAIEIGRRTLGNDAPEVTRFLIHLGRIERELGRLQSATEDHQAALAAAERGQGADHPLVASALHELALDLIDGGGDARALEMLQRAVTIGVKNNRPPSHREMSMWMKSLDAVRHRLEASGNQAP